MCLSSDSVKLALARFMHPVAFDMSDICNDTGTEVSGILGFSLLWLLDMKIDYCDGRIGFETT